MGRLFITSIGLKERKLPMTKEDFTLKETVLSEDTPVLEDTIYLTLLDNVTGFQVLGYDNINRRDILVDRLYARLRRLIRDFT